MDSPIGPPFTLEPTRAPRQAAEDACPSRAPERGAPAAPFPERGGFFHWVTTLVHTHRTRLVHLARREGLRPEDALDIVQDVFQHFLELPQAAQWMHTPEPAVDALIAQAEEHVRLRGCVRLLGEVQRQVVTLRMLDDVPGEDLAEQLGITRNHLRVLLHRARRQLLECLQSAEVQKPAAQAAALPNAA